MDAAYKKALSRCKTLSQAEAVELHRRMHDGDSSARDRLVESVLKLVYRIAMKYASVRNSAEELAAEGNTHAIRAVDDWNPDKAKLTTAVGFYVNNGLKEYLWRHGHNGIYLPLQTAKAIRGGCAYKCSERRRMELENARAASRIVHFSALPPTDDDKEFDVEDTRDHSEPKGFCLADIDQLLHHKATPLERRAFRLRYYAGGKHASHAEVSRELGIGVDECREMLKGLLKRLNRECSCKFCGERFVRGIHSKRYCSARCYRLSTISPGRHAECKHCGKSFLSHRGAKYCSERCVRHARTSRLHELYIARLNAELATA